MTNKEIMQVIRLAELYNFFTSMNMSIKLRQLEKIYKAKKILNKSNKKQYLKAYK